MYILLTFLFLAASFLSFWVKKDAKIWGGFLTLSLAFALIAKLLAGPGLLFIIALLFLWHLYKQKPSWALFGALIILSTLFKWYVLPGFNSYFITPRFPLGLEGALIGLFPLALFIPLAQTKKDWCKVINGALLGLGGIICLAFIALLFKATNFDIKIPSHMPLRIVTNLLFTCIPEEAFYRGFVQKKLTDTLQRTRGSQLIAILVASLLFTLVHLSWGASPAILGFVFLASLLYGFVYQVTQKIESAILTHFLLNMFHMLFFSYHRF